MATPRKHPKPEPVVVSTICSECGLDWNAHGDDPSAFDCIRLLKAEIAKPCQHWSWQYPASLPNASPWVASVQLGEVSTVTGDGYIDGTLVASGAMIN